MCRLAGAWSCRGNLGPLTRWLPLAIPLLVLQSNCGLFGSTANIAGKWRIGWAMSRPAPGAYNCSFVIDFTLTQSEGTFSGAQSGSGGMSCLNNTGSLIDVFGGATISGTVDGDKLDFSVNAVSSSSATVAGTSTGFASTSSMTGSATCTFTPNPGNTVELTGTWSAAPL